MIDLIQFSQHRLLLPGWEKRRRYGVDVAADDMRLTETPRPHQFVLLLRPGARHHRIVRVDAEVGAVLRETHRRVVEDVRGLRTRQDARRRTRLKVDAVLF